MHRRRVVDLSRQEKEVFIPILKRRIAELKKIDIESIQKKDDPQLISMQQKFDSTLADLFGGSLEYLNYYVKLDNYTRGENVFFVRSAYRIGIEKAISSLTTIIELFEENLKELEETSVGKALKALGNLDLHPEIEIAAGELFRNGHYANAVEDACKALDKLVQLRSKKDDLSGTKLMQAVFSPNKPILKFNDLTSQSEQDEQQGMMFLFSGAMLAFRNPRAHEIIEDDPEMALEYIAFISLLAKLLDKTRHV